MTNEQLVEQVKHGENSQANELLYLKMQRLIYWISQKYKGLAEMDDIQQEGYIGLLAAIEHYNSDFHVKFSTYAKVCIERHIQRYIGRERYKKHVVSLSSPIGEDTEDITLEEIIPDKQDIEHDVVESVYLEQLKNALWDAVSSLPEIQSAVITEVYREGMTRKAAGEHIGISADKVVYQEGRALERLRYGKNVKRLRAFYDEIYSSAINGTGNINFKRTWTSSTERTALRLYNSETYGTSDKLVTK